MTKNTKLNLLTLLGLLGAGTAAWQTDHFHMVRSAFASFSTIAKAGEKCPPPDAAIKIFIIAAF